MYSQGGSLMYLWAFGWIGSAWRATVGDVRLVRSFRITACGGCSWSTNQDCHKCIPVTKR